MSNKKPWKKEPRDHVKAFEVHKAQEIWGRFVRNHEKELERETEQQPTPKKPLLPDEPDMTGEELKIWLFENDPDRYERRAQQLKYEKLDVEKHCDPTVFWEGDFRITMVLKQRSGQLRRLKKTMGINDEEASVLLANLDAFPGLRFVHCFWTNTTKLVWDQPDSQELHTP